jgi:hypothetical protein
MLLSFLHRAVSRIIVVVQIEDKEKTVSGAGEGEMAAALGFLFAITKPQSIL